MDLTSQVPIRLDFTFTTSNIHNWALFLLWPSCFILSGATTSCPALFPSSRSGHLPAWGAHLPGSCLFAFSCCSWGSHGKDAGVVRHSLLQWTKFCQNSPLWLIYLGWPCMAWFIASLSCTNPFTMTRQWSMKGLCVCVCVCVCKFSNISQFKMYKLCQTYFASKCLEYLLSK